jgi:hypothetical protein
MKVRIYSRPEEAGGAPPVATVWLTEQSGGSQSQAAPEPAYVLGDVQAEDLRIKKAIRAVLERPSVPVVRSSPERREGGVRTRGDYAAEEPYGTPQYWRAAFGLLRAETGLTYDQSDYGKLLEDFATRRRSLRWQERLKRLPFELPVKATDSLGGTLREALEAAVEVSLGLAAGAAPGLFGVTKGLTGGEVRLALSPLAGARGSGPPDEASAVVQTPRLPQIDVTVNEAARTVQAVVSGVNDSILVALVPQGEAAVRWAESLDPTGLPVTFRFEGVDPGSYLLCFHRPASPPPAEPGSNPIRIPVPEGASGRQVEIRDVRSNLAATFLAVGPEIELELPSGLWMAVEPESGRRVDFRGHEGGVDLLSDAHRSEVRVRIPPEVVGKQIRLLDGQLRLAYSGTADEPELILWLPRGLWLIQSASGWREYLVVGG